MLDLSLLSNLITANWLVILLFFIIAIIYSSVGFGGGSSYLAILSLTGLAFTQIRATALLCNIVVVSGGTYLYAKKKLYNWKKVLPLVLFSVPMAFFGGYLRISQAFFFILLGITLVGASFSMLLSTSMNNRLIYLKSKHKKWYRNAGYGGIIGLVSGMVGIGGGVFLAPFLHLINWDNSKRIAATTSFFILLNSIAGLFGQYFNPKFFIEPHLTVVLLVTVFIGGQIGSRLSVEKFSPNLVNKITAVLIGIVGFRIILKEILALL